MLLLYWNYQLGVIPTAFCWSFRLINDNPCIAGGIILPSIQSCMQEVILVGLVFSLLADLRTTRPLFSAYWKLNQWKYSFIPVLSLLKSFSVIAFIMQEATNSRRTSLFIIILVFGRISSFEIRLHQRSPHRFPSLCLTSTARFSIFIVPLIFIPINMKIIKCRKLRQATRIYFSSFARVKMTNI